MLTVRDIEASHRFYTELLGFQRCGVYRGENCPTAMWFYRGSSESHHDFALVEAVGGAAFWKKVERATSAANGRATSGSDDKSAAPVREGEVERLPDAPGRIPRRRISRRRQSR